MIRLMLWSCLVSQVCLGQNISKSHFDPAEWSGTVSYVSITKSRWAGNYSEWIYHEWDILSELRMEAIINQGKGIATYNSSKTHYYKRTEKIVNRTEGYVQDEKLQAFGEGESQLGLGYSEGLYYIQVDIPACEGTRTVKITCIGCGEGTKTTTERYGEDPTLIIVDGQELGKNINVLSGEIVDKTSNENGGEFINITSWSLRRGPVEEELIVLPQQYTSWMPVPGKDESTPGSQMTVKLKLQGKNGKAPSFKVNQFELKLLNTSKEKGTTINYPINGGEQFDLRFVPGEGYEVLDEGQTVRFESADGLRGEAAVAAYDGGGYADLEATAVLESGIRIRGHLETPSGPVRIPIPKRASASKIATVWLEKNGKPHDDDDEDKSFGNSNNGDGLTAYEEYRGVWTQNKHLRLDPKKKELGIQVLDKDEMDFAAGIALFEQASGVDVIRLNKDELDSDRIINANSSSTKKQYALRLENDQLSTGAVGGNEPLGTLKKTPRKSERVVIDVSAIRSGYAMQKQAASQAGVPLPYSAEDELSVTVAHEITHGVNVDHHGDPEPSVNRTAYAGSEVVYKIYGSDRKEITDRPFDIKGRIGVRGNESSGDLSCIMAYTNEYQWVFTKADDGSLVYHALPFIAPGKKLCTSARGTGLNSTGYFGDATRGNCLPQIKVKDE